MKLAINVVATIIAFISILALFTWASESWIGFVVVLALIMALGYIMKGE